MTLCEEELQEDVFAALDGNISGWTVHAASRGVSQVDEKRIVLSSQQSIRHGSKTTDGQDLDVTIDFWDRSRDDAATKSAMSSALSALDSWSYSLTGFDVLEGFPRLTFSRILTENTDEGDPFVHGILRLRYVTHEQ